MSSADSLDGGCSCGRNKFVVLIPAPADANDEVPRIFFDNGHHHRRSQATPLSAWLRVPLAWYHSTTYAFFDDETHASIRKSYTSPQEQHAKRHFCGFCGTPLSYWTESPAEEAEYISLTLGTLSSEKLRNLEESGLLPKEATADVIQEKTLGDLASSKTGSPKVGSEHQGLPWFDTMLEGSRLGNMKMSMGSSQSRDGTVQVQWEIAEWTAEGEDEAASQTPPSSTTTATTKRKLGDVIDEDSKMEEVSN